MKIKIALFLSLFTFTAVAAGLFAFRRTVPLHVPDFRDAVSDHGAGSFDTSLPAVDGAGPDLPAPAAEKVKALPQGLSRYTVLHPVPGTSVTVDHAAGLAWITDPEAPGLGGKYNWLAAERACNRLDYAGYRDWRLPEKEELSGILPAAHSEFFLNTGDLYWTATGAVAPPDSAWTVNFAKAAENAAGRDETASIRCVRADAALAKSVAARAAEPAAKGPGAPAQDRGAAARAREAAGASAGGSRAGGRAPGALPAPEAAGTDFPASAEREREDIRSDGKAAAVAGAGVAGLNVMAGAHFLNAMALENQALAMKETALLLAGQARAAAGARNLAQAQQLGAEAKAIGATAKATGSEALKTARAAVTMTAVSGVIMVAEGIWNIHTGREEGKKLKEELLLANEALETAQDPAAAAAALRTRDTLQEKAEKAKELVVVGGVKTAGGALQLGSLFVAPAAAPILLAAGTVAYIAAVIYHHRETIKNFFRRLFGRPEVQASGADAAESKTLSRNEQPETAAPALSEADKGPSGNGMEPDAAGPTGAPEENTSDAPSAEPQAEPAY